MPLVPFDALLGPSYTMFSPKAEIQRSLNTRRERVESGEGVGPYALMKAFGCRAIFQPTGVAGKFRGGFELNGQAIIVIDGSVLSLSAYNLVGFTYAMAVTNDGQPVRIAYSPVSALILSAGTLYRANGGVLTTPAMPAAFVDIVYINTYFVGITGTTEFYFSSDDGVTWNAGDVQNVESSSNNLLAGIVHQEILYLYGTKITQPFTVGSSATAPFVEQQSAVIPYGIKAAATLRKIGLFRYWLGVSEEGGGVVYRGQGYSTQRISNLGLENKIREYEETVGTVDAIGFSFILGGQEYYRLTFPAADATWELNCTITEATGVPEWSEVGWFDSRLGIYHRHRANMILSAFGKILVGDYSNGWLYELRPDEYTDFGYPLPTIRRAPHIIQTGLRVSYDQLRLGMETGVGLASPLWLQSYSMQRGAFATALAAQVSGGNVTAAQAIVLQDIYDLNPYIPLNPYPSPATMSTLGFTPWGASVQVGNTVLGSEPRIGLQYSNNGGKSFTQPLLRDLGLPGDDVDVNWNGLGQARDRVFQLTESNPTKLAIVTAFLDAEPLAS